LAVKRTIHAEVDAALAAEVVVLRDEVHMLRAARARLEGEVRALCATIARVEALCDLWLEADPDTRTHVCGDRLRAALRGEP
jgi:hypothetical protein